MRLRAPVGRPVLVDANGRPLASTPPTRRVITPGAIDSYNSHPAQGLTAEMLIAYYRMAERGNPVRMMDTFTDGIEVDGHLRGLVEGRIENVSGCNWVLAPGRDDKPSRIAADLLTERLRAHLGFREFIEHQLGGAFFGYACTNIVWQLDERIVVPSQFINGAPRRFAAPDSEHASGLWLVDGDRNQKLIELEAGLWAVSRYRHPGCSDNPYASGLMRTLMWWALFKRWSVRDWQVFAEMFGLPLALGYYEEGASEDSRRVLENAVKLVGTDGYAVLSAMTELVLKSAAREGDSSTVYPLIIKLAEAQMSKLVTGATLTVDGGSGVGSYAQSTVHADREHRKAQADAVRLQEMWVRDVAIPFNVWNGFDRAAAPLLNMQISNATLERARVLEIIGQAVDIDEDQIREEFALKRPAAGRGIRFPAKPASKGEDHGPN